MRLKPQYVFIIAVVGVLAIYFIGMSLLSGGKKAEAKAPPNAGGPPSVQVKLTPETVRQVEVVMRGRTEAARSVVIRSETAGVVAATPAPEGAFVKQGQVLCRLSVDARQAQLDQARAMLKSRQLQREGAAQLAEKGLPLADPGAAGPGRPGRRPGAGARGRDRAETGGDPRPVRRACSTNATPRSAPISRPDSRAAR
jgi:multidrug efflux pump subunit AcrA (membrane-fusion protein)